MPEDLQTASGEEAEFRELLRQLLEEGKTRAALLINPVFQRRLLVICQSFCRNKADADVLANEVRTAVCEKFDKFTPDYKQPFGNFFGWVKCIARNKFIDKLRSEAARSKDSQLDEAYVVQDDKVDIEAEAARREALDRFWAFVDDFDEVTQKIMHYHLEDYSTREIKEMLAAEGIHLSHVTIGNTLKRVVADFLTSEDTRIAAMIARKGEHQSRGRDKDGPPARKTGS